MSQLYQLILIGESNPYEEKLLAALYQHISELGLESKLLIVIDKNNFKRDYKANCPSFCLYFGSTSVPHVDLDILDLLTTSAILVLPVVKDLTSFSHSIPRTLCNINGFELASDLDIEKLVSCILEGLSLLRLSRRLFISYKRDESSSVAIQLYEQLEKNGFDVFLDTHSIRPGEPFQEELWHRMADTDIVVLLNTPGFLKSNWTTEELAKANAMSIGVLQLIWPEHTPERAAELSIPYQLNNTDFEMECYSGNKSYLLDDTVKDIVSKSESLRARSLASRQDNIITEFIASANRLNKAVELQPENFITIKSTCGKERIIIPTVGVPQALTYNQSQELVHRIKTKHVEEIYVLYDHRHIRDRWIKHLDWLDSYLPVKTIKIVEAEKWLLRL